MSFPLNQPIFLDAKGCPTDETTNTFAFVVDSYSSQHQTIINLIKQNVNVQGPTKLCRGNVSPQYVEDSLTNANIIVALFHNISSLDIETQKNFPNEDANEILINFENRRNYRLYGFASCYNKRLTSNNEDNSLYIDVICANLEPRFKPEKTPPAGKALLHIVTEYARSEYFDYVSLSALINVINYYRQFGFRHLKEGQTIEHPDIAHLAELNKGVKINDSNEADLIIKTERAIQIANTSNDFDNTLAQEIKSALKLDELPDEVKLIEYVGMLPLHAQENGKDGFLDFVLLLTNNGFSSEDDKVCDGIRRLNYTDIDNIINCSSSGFIMRKPLTPVTEQDTGIDLDAPIINCSQTGGNRRRKSRKLSKKHRRTKSRSSKKQRTHISRKRIPQHKLRNKHRRLTRRHKK